MHLLQPYGLAQTDPETLDGAARSRGIPLPRQEDAGATDGPELGGGSPEAAERPGWKVEDDASEGLQQR